MGNETKIEMEIVESLLKHARILRGATDPRKAIEAGKWELIFQEKLQELQKNFKCVSASSHSKPKNQMTC